MKSIILLMPILMIFAACSTNHPIKPDGNNVEVKRVAPDDDCKEIGPVEGRVSSIKGTFDDALKDLKDDAARKGANYVYIQQTGAMGQAVSGQAYFCE